MRLESAIEVLKDQLNISYTEALQLVIKRDISKLYGIDLKTESTLFDLGVELISCYSAVPTLYEQNGVYTTKISFDEEKPIFCSECGAKLDSESAFCPECGARV